MTASHALSQLSYSPKEHFRKAALRERGYYQRFLGRVNLFCGFLGLLQWLFGIVWQTTKAFEFYSKF
jgi:hypothetical protein